MPTLIIPATKDTYASSGSPDDPGGSSDNISIGKYSDGVERSYTFFDLSSIPITVPSLISAHIFLYQIISGIAAALTFDIYRVTGSWTEEALTWNNQPAIEVSPTITGLSCSTDATGWKNWDITALIEECRSETYTGIMLRAQSESGSDSGKLFLSRNVAAPYLSVSYSSIVKIWNGAAWVENPVKVWDGAAWSYPVIKRYNGATWEIV